ncbi:hypothetical protein [Bifidobacterium breve]|uniref:hypothetical protein n=1 Tax=Bifidobacterium breve TaxID=1685 RepID=UPI00080BA7CF|nr:hypothetical protein [Bifidobacterium breve]
MTQARKGPRLPLSRQDEAILAGPWLSTQLGRKLRAAEAQTFGRMVYDEWVKTHPGTLPYTVRIDSSQKTAYLPEDLPLLHKALTRYTNSKSNQRIQTEIKGETK